MKAVLETVPKKLNHSLAFKILKEKYGQNGENGENLIIYIIM